MIVKPTSKQILVESLKDLLKSQPFDKITIQAIVDNCQLTRTTFYRHFRDKYELIDWYYKQEIEAFNARKQNHDPNVTWLDVSRNVIEFFEENAAFFKAVLEYKGQNSFEDFWYNYVRDYCLESIKLHNGTTDISVGDTLAVNYHVGGNTKVMLDWVRGGCKEPSGVVLETLYACIPRSLEKYFKD